MTAALVSHRLAGLLLAGLPLAWALLAAPCPPPAAAAPRRVPGLRLPVAGPLTRPFEAPASRYAPGHRGIDLAAPPGAPVRAPAAGRVRFAGPVAGMAWVSIEAAPGVTVTVGPLAAVRVRAGQAVPALAPLGRLAPGHAGALHLGLRIGGAYADPLPYLAGAGRPRLVPLPPPGPGGQRPLPTRPAGARSPLPLVSPALCTCALLGAWCRRRGGREPAAGSSGVLSSAPPEEASGKNARPLTGPAVPASGASRSGSPGNPATGDRGTEAGGGGQTSRARRRTVAVVTMRQLLEAGVHFGHQTRRWNPKMKRYIFGERNGIYVIDLQKTMGAIERAYEFLRDTVAKGGTVLFIGTKKQAQEAIKTQAERVSMPYVNYRWLGGMLTNFTTIYKRLQRLKELEAMESTGATEVLPKKEVLRLVREREKLERDLGGIRDMTRLPSAVWIVDTRKEHIAVTEARKLGIPVVAILDTNCDPDEVDYPIPGNDDAIRSANLLTRIVADAVAEGLRLRAVYAGEGAKEDSIAASPADEEPLAEWERELLEAEEREQAEGSGSTTPAAAQAEAGGSATAAGQPGAGGASEEAQDAQEQGASS